MTYPGTPPPPGFVNSLVARLSPMQALVTLVLLSALAGALMVAILDGHHWAIFVPAALAGRVVGAILGHLMRMLPRRPPPTIERQQVPEPGPHAP
jgi:hypothetical protein